MKGKLDEVISVTRSDNSGQVSLLVSLQEMKNFLLSYASKVIVEEPSNSYSISVGIGYWPGLLTDITWN